MSFPRYSLLLTFLMLGVWAAISTVAAAERICISADRFSGDLQGPIENECTVMVEGYPSDLMCASMCLFLSGEEGGFIAVGVRADDTVLLADQTVLTAEGRLVVFDLTIAVQYAIENELTTFALSIGPGLLGRTGDFGIGQFEGCWGQLSFIGQPPSGSSGYSKALGRGDVEFIEVESAIMEGVWVRLAPNPANPNITFAVLSDRNSSVDLRIYDLVGRLVAEFSRYANKGALLTIDWNGDDKNGGQVPSGVYLYRLGGDAIQARVGKISVVR